MWPSSGTEAVQDIVGSSSGALLHGARDVAKELRRRLDDALEVAAFDGEDLALVERDDARVALLAEKRGGLADERASLHDHGRAVDQERVVAFVHLHAPLDEH